MPQIKKQTAKRRTYANYKFKKGHFVLLMHLIGLAGLPTLISHYPVISMPLKLISF